MLLDDELDDDPPAESLLDELELLEESLDELELDELLDWLILDELLKPPPPPVPPSPSPPPPPPPPPPHAVRAENAMAISNVRKRLIVTS